MRKIDKRYFLLLVLSAILLSGCAAAGGEDAKRSAAQEAETKNTSTQETEAKGTSTQKTETGNTSSPEELSMQLVFEGQDMEGNVVSSAVFSEAKLTMVNVWATYCNPCLREMPDLGELASEYASEEFQIIGIVSDVQAGADQEGLALAADLIERTGAGYTHLPLNESLYYALLTDVTAVPTTFFIDENGVILDTVIGAMDKSAWEEKINALLEEQ